LNGGNAQSEQEK
jgi:chromatin assembly factor 1 subunit A